MKQVGKIYLIHPVNRISCEERKFLDSYVSDQESAGVKVYYPIRDVNQEDSVGLKICKAHREAMKGAGRAHLFYSPESIGSIFDLGMCFKELIPLSVINPNDVLDGPDGFTKTFIKEYSLGVGTKYERNFLTELHQRRLEILTVRKVSLRYTGKTPEFLFYFGMVFASEIPIELENPHEIEKTPHKSYENVLLTLTGNY